MTITKVTKDDNCQLQNIANALANAKKVVVITGAGISTNCGIPDFRSEEGLYSLIQAQRDGATAKRRPDKIAKRQPLSSHQSNVSPSKKVTKPPSIPSNIKGKDLFDAQLWKDPNSTSVFYKFIASLRRNIQEDVKRATATHRFIRTLRDKRKLVRCYTQNIDGLEAREDLCTDMERGKGNRARFSKRSLEKPRNVSRSISGGDLDGGCEVVQLHGDLDVLRCTLCQQKCSWGEHDREAQLMAGNAPTCHWCMTTDLDRQIRGKRGTKIGTLRPNIVLYGEEHPSADSIGKISSCDLALSPDLLLILGTSLHVHGLKVLVKEFAKSVHSRPGGKGKVVFVNLSKPPESAWKDVFDYWVSMDCDEWVKAMRRHRFDLFQIQDDLRLKVTKQNVNSIPKMVSSPYFLGNGDGDKENAATTAISTPRKPVGRPRKVVTPKKTVPLEDRSPRGDKYLQANAGGQKSIDQQQLENQLQLPTPPPTAHKTQVSTPSRKRSLADSYRELCETPSKRKKSAMTVWEDQDELL